MTTALAPIEILPALPPAPYLLADTKWLSTLAEFEQRISEIEITSPESAQLAADLQVRITKAGSSLEATRSQILQPILDLQRKINATARPIEARINAAKLVLSNKQIFYQSQQSKIRRDAEQKRLNDIAALEKKQAAEKAEADRKAKAVADEAAHVERERLAKFSAEQRREAEEFSFLDEEPVPPADLPLPEKTETERQLEAARFAPAPVKVEPKGVTIITELRFEVTDVNLLPDHFIVKTAREQAIRAAYCTAWKPGQSLPVCAGVEFRVHEYSKSTGKAQF